MVNPNIDAVGEVQVISNGFTAENGRSNGGLIIMTTKSGTSRFKGSAWYNARREEWNANDYFSIKQNLAKPLYHVNIPGYSIGGPIVIPKVLDKGKMFFFVLAGVHRRPAADRRHPRELPDGARAAGRLLADLLRQRERARAGHAAGDHQSRTRACRSRATRFRSSCAGIAGCENGHMNPMGLAMLNLLPLPNDIHNPHEQSVQRGELDLRDDAAAQPHEQHVARSTWC